MCITLSWDHAAVDPRKEHFSNSGSMSHFVMQNASQLPSELLHALEGQCLRRQEDWWTYELCFGDFVRQMHLELGQMVSEYLLGSYNAEDTTVGPCLPSASV